MVVGMIYISLCELGSGEQIRTENLPINERKPPISRIAFRRDRNPNIKIYLNIEISMSEIRRPLSIEVSLIYRYVPITRASYIDITWVSSLDTYRKIYLVRYLCFERDTYFY